jgi:nitrogen fixation protein FixH
MTALAGRPLTGKHVLGMLLGFFAFMLIANGFFVYFALTSFSGLSTDDPYQKGLNYNQALAAKVEQQARGWISDLRVDEVGPGEVLITLSVLDANGNAIDLSKAAAVLRRPAVQGEDVRIDFSKQGPALVSSIKLEKLGNWDLKIMLHGGGYNEPYRLEKRLWVK